MGDLEKGMVRIDPAAREHIARAGGAVTLRGSRRHGCCGGTAFVPVAEEGPPDEASAYWSAEVNGITVFIREDMEIGSAPLVIGLDELWGLRRLRVEGSAIWM